MQRSVMPTTPRPVVLLVQQERDDGLETYAEYAYCYPANHAALPRVMSVRGIQVLCHRTETR